MFGWSSSILQEWYHDIILLLHRELRPYHEGILNFLTEKWQKDDCVAWFVKHAMNSTFLSYVERIKAQNSRAQRSKSNAIATVNAGLFRGSLFAVDGTYSLSPAIGAKVLSYNGYDPHSDIMYSEYVKCHAYKIVLLTSHGVGDGKKFILGMEIAAGSTSDAAVYLKLMSKIEPQLVPEAAGLGDHAFHGSRLIICPYTIYDITVGNEAEMSAFNHNHSKDRHDTDDNNIQDEI
jgi:hypothetical protein